MAGSNGRPFDRLRALSRESHHALPVRRLRDMRGPRSRVLDVGSHVDGRCHCRARHPRRGPNSVPS